MDELKNMQGKPMNIYCKLSTKANILGEYQGVPNPLNIKQVQNHQAISKSSQQVSKDDIYMYNMIQLAYNLELRVRIGNYSFPDLMTSTVFALPEIVRKFTKILQSYASTPVSLVYDTTFNLGVFMSHH